MISLLHRIAHQEPSTRIPFLSINVRFKQTKVQSYSKPDRSFPHSQHYVDKAHVGIRALSSEYVEASQMLVKQRKYISKNPFVTRHRHFKLYPGENVRVTKNTSLVAMVSGRVKFTHDVKRDVMIVNVLPEPREELLSEELWRYRTEHIESREHNKQLCLLRQKMLPTFPRELVNPPTGPRPAPTRISKDGSEHWNSVTVRDPLRIEPFPFALSGSLLKRHIDKCLGKSNDPTFTVTDRLADYYRGKSAQRYIH
jgi:ribosomal protein L27